MRASRRASRERSAEGRACVVLGRLDRGMQTRVASGAIGSGSVDDLRRTKGRPRAIASQAAELKEARRVRQ